VNLRKSLSSWQRKNYFGELVYHGDMREGKEESSALAPRLYVFVRDDLLPPIHQGIQAAHACISLAHYLKDRGGLDPNTYLILLGASRTDMAKAMKLRHRSIPYIDMGLVDPETGMPVLTALAFEPMSLTVGNKLFKHLKRAQ
jgi:hypothetical protein